VGIRFSFPRFACPVENAEGPFFGAAASLLDETLGLVVGLPDMQPELVLSVHVEWTLELGPESARFLISEGRCEGAVSGRYRGSSIRRPGDAFGDLCAAIDADDGSRLRLRRSGSRIDLTGPDGEPTLVGPALLAATPDGFAVYLRPRALAA
jgi:hypothetical protein